jgi:Domain of unknown function (DUF4138)
MCRMANVALFIASLFCGTSYKGFGQTNPPFSLRPMGAAIVRVSTGRITNLIFPGAVRTGIKVSNDILVQKVKGVDNVIELKAMRKGFSPTGVSIFSVAGRIYSFLVEYSDSAEEYDFSVVDTNGRIGVAGQNGQLVLAGMPATAQALRADADSLIIGGYLSQTQEYERVRLRLRGIYLKDSLLWIAFDLRNRSLVPYKTDYLRVYSTERKRVKRTASHESDINPKYLPGLPVAGGQSTAAFCAAFAPFTLSKGETLNVEIGEANGGRTIKMMLSPKILLKARQ